jgi:hypothetical protein
MKKDNWVVEGSKEEVRSKAQALLDEVKEKRKTKKFKLVRVDDKTFKEVEITE